MEKVKTADLEIPEKEHLVIPVHDWRDKEGFIKWYDELEPRIRNYWVGRKVRFIKENEIKEIIDVSFHRVGLNFLHGNDTYLITFIFEKGGDEYIVYDNYMYCDLFEIL
ncbi:MAG: hypothetical protein ACYDCN_07320 [Bacteroidia bacterium]